MGSIWFDETEGRLLEERYDLAIGRIREILQEQAVPADFISYFHDTARFILLCDEVKQRLETGAYDADPEQMKADNRAMYLDILPEHYSESLPILHMPARYSGMRWEAAVLSVRPD